MIKDPVVPLSPSLLPQQRLYEVKALPTWPSGVKPIVGYPGELGVPDLPKRRSRNAIYLCQAEWAWTPHHNRLAAYYLSRGRRQWLLWLGDHNDGTIPWSWEWGIVALVSHKGVEERTAASLLLAAYWAFQRDDSDLDRYHWLNDTAYLDVGEAIARAVWGDDD
jgi:hypothetical protein